jgi:dGTPase
MANSTRGPRTGAKQSGSSNLYHMSDWARVVAEPPLPSWRPEISRDYARVIHSASFRRLQGKTQVFPGHESDFFRNRLTHSLEVAQIARGIAARLNYEIKELKNDPINEELCTVAALLHDIGHPPFGHNGERALDQQMLTSGGFEGNAQSLRIIAKLEKKITPGSDLLKDRYGLNLTFRTMAAVLKYDREILFYRPETDYRR